ncbi:hypothetical protein [Nitrosovibrio tenuis]|uniref:Lipoprotein-attachment site-containing protein n=1 Tax=Nitrosovibrio tenuis TaxID=1233 RepID=A0A1H7QK88_9PROT|nr:hypothetical protein [Nitrosovibrio tenuis]SEL48382.1 hypothetical protein SAMN05216387_11252 [Nitrosovibrio tenuis]
MRLTLLSATLVALTMTACGKPNQALPEQEKDNFAKITKQQGAAGSAPAAPAAPGGSTAPESASGDAAKK